MQFVNEDDRLSPIGGQAIASGLQDFAHLSNSRSCGVQAFKMATSLFGDQFGQRCFSSAGRAVEDHGTDAVSVQHSAEKLPVGQNMLLACEFRKYDRPHPRRQRPGTVAILLFVLAGRSRHSILHTQTLNEHESQVLFFVFK